MPKTAEDILNTITKINNIKYNNNNNNTSIVSEENDEEEMTTSSCRGLASLSASQKPFEVALMPPGKLPAPWRGVKLDLFANPAHTLKINIIRQDGTSFACSSQMNSPRTHVFRGRDQGQGTQRHWHLVEYLMELRDDYDYRISKVSRPRKGGTINDFVAMIYHTDGVWHADLVYKHKIWSFRLDKPSSQAFRDKNGIATTFVGIASYQKPWIEGEELGI